MNKNILHAAIIAAAAALAAPAFAADLPQSAELQYSGSYGIPATMTFTRSGNSYKIVSNIKVPLYRIRFESCSPPPPSRPRRSGSCHSDINNRV